MNRYLFAFCMAKVKPVENRRALELHPCVKRDIARSQCGKNLYRSAMGRQTNTPRFAATSSINRRASLDPSVSTTGIFFTQIVSTLFFVGGAVLVFLGALYSSYSIWPVFPESAAEAVSPSFTSDAPVQMLGTLDGMLKVTVIISAPVIIVMFLATLGLGLVNRTAPQLNVFFLSMPVKSALGIAMLMVYLPFILDMLMYDRQGAILAPARRLLGG